MSNKTPRANKNVTESAPSRSYTWLIAPLCIFLLLVVAGVAAVLVADSREPETDCVILSSDEQAEEVCVALEVADTREKQIRGLSGRESMPLNKGMLFDFGDIGRHCMWMPDMHFSIDIIWLSPSEEVVDIAESVHPDSYPDEIFCNESGAARYVIEVNAGVVEAADMHVGQQIQL